MHKKLIVFALCAVCLSNSLYAESNVINFYPGNFSEVRDLAASQEKLIFWHITASWCATCDWMEDNTFHDSKLAGLVNTYFIAGQMDIDDQRAKGIRQYYNIHKFPTILVLDGDGKELFRSEEVMDANRLYDALRPLVPQADLAISPQPRNLVFSKPILTPDKSAPRPSELENSVVAKNLNPTFRRPAPRRIKVAASTVSASGFTPKTDAQEFTIQAGRYADYDQAIKRVRALEADQEASVQIRRRGKSHYVLVGSFHSEEDAKIHLREVSGNASVLPMGEFK